MPDNYSIASGDGTSAHGALVELVREVRELMQHGWIAQGGAFYCGTEHRRGYAYHIFSQVVVKPQTPALLQQGNEEQDAN